MALFKYIKSLNHIKHKHKKLLVILQQQHRIYLFFNQ